MTRFCRLLFFVLVFAGQALCQQPVPTANPTRRDPAALSILTTAMAAMGVQNATTITTAQAVGTIAPVGNSGYPSGNFTWTTEITSNGYEVRNQSTSGGNVSIFASGHGSPKMSANGAITPFFAHMAQASPPLHFPFLLFAVALSNQNYTVVLVNDGQGATTSTLNVHISDDTDGIAQPLSAEEWYFDPNTGLPLRVEGRVPDPFNALHSLSASKQFTNYQSFGNILVPTQITSSLNGRPVSAATITSVQFNLPVPDSAFDLAQGVN